MSRFFPPLIMAAFGGFSVYRAVLSGELFFIFFALRDFLAAYFLFRRDSAVTKSGVGPSMIAYLSSALPLFYLGAADSSAPILSGLLSLAGFLLAGFALIDLAGRFGVSPAYRGSVCRSGVYRWLRHPMYIGYAIAESGRVLLNPLNGLIYLVSILLYILRARLEENHLKSHA